jgi:hypothetical protein
MLKGIGVPKKKLLGILLSGKPENPPCLNMGDLFYGPPLVEEDEEGNLVEYDKRRDPEVEEREAKAKAVCSTCQHRLPCLERAVVWERNHSLKNIYGVWGGMGEAERRQFHRHLTAEGYKGEVPTGVEFLASVRSFYKQRLSVIVEEQEQAS